MKSKNMIGSSQALSETLNPAHLAFSPVGIWWSFHKFQLLQKNILLFPVVLICTSQCAWSHMFAKWSVSYFCCLSLGCGQLIHLKSAFGAHHLLFVFGPCLLGRVNTLTNPHCYHPRTGKYLLPTLSLIYQSLSLSLSLISIGLFSVGVPTLNLEHQNWFEIGPSETCSKIYIF